MSPKIIIYPNPFLLKKTAPVENIKSPKIQEIAKEMKVVLQEAGGIGLAANQIGKDARIFIVYLENKFYIFINPEIIKMSKKTALKEEACLSVPGVCGMVERAEKIAIAANNEKGSKIKKSAKGLFARIIQHEIDHLNGVLFIDKARDIQKIELKK